MIEPARQPARHILLVDDSKSARFALAAMLKKHGFSVDGAASAEAAMEMIRQRPPDAIFLDHMMPGMDGYEATKALKAEPATRHIPIVMCTSNDQPEYVRKARELGALGILPKPATPERMREILDALDRQLAPPPAAGPAAPAPEAATQPHDPEAVLRTMPPQLVEEILAPVVERLVREHLHSAQAQGVSQTQIDAAVAQRLETSAGGWLTELTDTTERRIAAEFASAEQRLAKTLDERLAELADRQQRELEQRILADQGLRASISAVAAADAERKAAEVSHAQSERTARETATALLPSLLEPELAATEERLVTLGRKCSWLAAAAGLAVALGAVAAYLAFAA